MLDPYYRTIKGFQVALSSRRTGLPLGTSLATAGGHIQKRLRKEVSPVFTQLLDCTWQLMQQRNDAFEFNERFLLIPHDHVMSCQFGTFVGNCEKDRLDLRLAEKTFSLWGFVEPLERRINSFKNMISKSAKRLQGNKYVDNRGIEVNDNRYNYDKRLSELSCADDDHPLKTSNFSFSNLAVRIPPSANENNVDVAAVTDEINSVAIDWKPLRSVPNCSSCSIPFDQITKKQNHCWKCGEVFCSRCIDKTAALPGHESGNPVPVCRNCFREVQQVSP
ncbi:hypothetical protein pipiens_020109, partial [Culex pipiens pipiens]